MSEIRKKAFRGILINFDVKNRLFLVSISASLHVQIHAVVSLHAHFSEVSLK